MVFREYPALFFHIPKTAGVSVENWLGGPHPADALVPDYDRLFGFHAASGYPLQHATPDIVRDIIGHEVMRFEGLPDSIKPVAEHLRVTRPLPFANVYRHPTRGYRPVSSFYRPETARILADVYAEDFETFGYPTELEAANESTATQS